MRIPKFRVWDNVDYMSKPFTLSELQAGLVQFDCACPIMQFTGLKDKNGVEIYEGDVVKYLTHTAHIFWSPQDFGFVHYNDVIGDYAGLSFFTGYKSFEVIGNVYQNPELLDKNDD